MLGNDKRSKIDELPYRICVGIMLVNRDGKIFVGQRNDTEEEAWQMPQGGVEEGETLETAALRELEEEIGIGKDKVTVIKEADNWIFYDFPIKLQPVIWDGKYRGQQQKWFLMKFEGEDKEIDINTDNPEFSSWKWLNVSDLPKQIVSFKRDAYLRVIEEFGEYVCAINQCRKQQEAISK